MSRRGPKGQPQRRSGAGRGLGRLATSAVASAGAQLAWRGLTASPPGGAARWTRTNHRGEPVSLLEGPAVVLGATAALLVAPGTPARVRAAGTIALLGAGAVGLADDLSGSGAAKGFAGHLGALRRGEVTTGAIKVAGIGATGLVAAALAAPAAGRRARAGRAGEAGRGGRGGRGGRASLLDVVLGGALVAGTANLLNLFDLRPGRAVKVTLALAPVVSGAGPAAGLVAAATGSGAAMLPVDLGERAMLGDCGANALGALLGTAAVAGRSRTTRTLLLAGVVALTLASEKVSFTKVIESTAGLRQLDALGRRPR